MTDAELIAKARLAQRYERNATGELFGDLADRIEALIAERDEAMQLLKTLSNMNGDLSRNLYKAKLLLAKAEAGLREIAAEASVPVHTWKNGINFKKMYEGWRKIAVERIDIARATLAEIKGESQNGQ